ELIAKIHNAYPQLSILWLLFNEGSMETNTNIKISRPLNSDILDFSSAESANNKTLINDKNPNISTDILNQSREFETDLFTIINETELSAPSTSPQTEEQTSLQKNKDNTYDNSDPSGKAKRIVNIMVFYDDNSFDTFVPRSSTK
ncbi:MAG: hypothetical protein K2M76_00790, partial [Muribaculaceae bacterium]|nr:hypothetical protein [Muribaculaceae bacterium]